MKVLVRKSVFLYLEEDYKKNEEALQKLLDKINDYRMKPVAGEIMISKVAPH